MDFNLPELFSSETLRELFESAGQDQDEFFAYVHEICSALERPQNDFIVPIYVLWTIGYTVEDAILFMDRPTRPGLT